MPASDKVVSTPRAITIFSRDEIIKLFKTAVCKKRFKGLELRCAPKTNPIARILIVTPRACGNAVTRNKLRRQIKAIFYQERLFEEAYDCILLARKEAVTLSFQEICDFLKS